MTPQGHSLGWRPQGEAIAKARWQAAGGPPRLTSAMFGASPVPLPTAYTLADLISFWFNQGQVGSCFANATTQAEQIATAFAARQGLIQVDEVQLSRAWVWYQGRKLDGLIGYSSDGGTVTNAVRSIHEAGICPETAMPYKASHAWLERTPTSTAIAAAKGYGLRAVLDLEFSDTEGIKQAIFAGQPPVMGIWWPYGWDEGQIDEYGRTNGIGGGEFGHALVMAGWVDPGVWDTYRWWHIINSHGSIYPLPSPEMVSKVQGYGSARPDSCYSFWVRDDLLQQVAGYGSAELVAPIGPFAPTYGSPVSWSSSAS